MQLYDAIVIGAGPAGLFAAIQAAEKSCRVLVLEKQPEPGSKLLLTGAGQCNFTNARPIQEFLHAYGEHGLFLKPALFHFTNQDIRSFFRQQGLESIEIKETGKIFPASFKARDVLNILLVACQRQQVEIRYGRAVTQILPTAEHVFRLSTASTTFHSRNVVLATGGLSYPATGSTGDGYALAQSLGHTIIPPKPGLAPFLIKNFMLADLAGTSFKDLAATLWQGNKKLKTLSGDMVITHQGLSGPVVQNLARSAGPHQNLTLAFVPHQNLDELKQKWLADCERRGKEKTGAWIKHYPLTQALAKKIMVIAKVDPELSMAKLGRSQRLAWFQWVSAFPMEISAVGDFNSAMVTCGGVDLQEVNGKTMESRLVPGLHFAGEILDIDGDCGGYDLQAAWSTAALAAFSISRSLRQAQ